MHCLYFTPCPSLTLETWKLKHFLYLKLANHEKLTLPNLRYSLKHCSCIISTFLIFILGHLLNQKSVMQFRDVFLQHEIIRWRTKSGITCPPPACESPSSAPCLHQFPCLDEEPSRRHRQHSLRSRQALSCREIRLPHKVKNLPNRKDKSLILKLTVKVGATWISL